MKDEDRVLLNELGLSERELNETYRKKELHPAVAVGLGAFFVANVAILLSLPPVLRGKGAPYLPTFQKGMDAMFVQLRSEPNFRKRIKQGDKMRFVDLGSGDGRVVFRAAQEKLFHACIGYEINPLLHLLALGRRFVQPKVWSSTGFQLADIWKVDLAKADVVAVYGLGPIMEDLGIKLKNELKPGSYVLSNVFTIPGWRAVSSSDGTYIYLTPQCWEKKDSTP